MELHADAVCDDDDDCVVGRYGGVQCDSCDAYGGGEDGGGGDSGICGGMGSGGGGGGGGDGDGAANIAVAV